MDYHRWFVIVTLEAPRRSRGPGYIMIRFARTLAACLLLPLAAGGVRAQAPLPAPEAGPIAVLPFANLSPDPDDAWLGDGIAETLTAELEARGLNVVGRARDWLAAGGAAVGGGEPAGGDALGDLGQLHRRLGARWAVTGSYQQIGQRLRINARIVDLPSAVVVHAVRTDGERHEIFALQDRIAGDLAAGLSGDRLPTRGSPQPRRPDADLLVENAAPPRRGGPPAGNPLTARPGESPAALSSAPWAPRRPAEAAPVPGGTAGRQTAPVPRRPAAAAPGMVGSVGREPVAAPRRPAETAPSLDAGEARRRESAPAPLGPAAAAPARREPAATSAGARIPNTAAESAGRFAGVGIASGAGILTGRPSVRPERTAAAPRIDGTLDDPVWERATRISDFVQQRPLDGAPATEDSEVYIAYDNDNLYFGIRAHYSDPALIRANRADRDQTFIDDTVAVYFDPFLDQQRAYVFSVNGYGVQADSLLESSAQRMSGGGGGGGRPGGGGGRTPGSGRGGMSAALAASLGAPPTGDLSWDALFDSAARLVADGWTAEMAIPFKSLRYPERRPGEPHRWGFQIVRTIFGKDEADVWSPVSRGVAGFLTQMGLLDGLTNLSTSRNLEILPTLTAIRYGSLDASTGSFEEATQPEGALNLKYGVTPNLTADFTYNPDFSQIESDTPQIEVNQRYPLFFPELRPFFLEGQEVFTLPGQINLLHTRTIVDPRYGAKLTGKVGNTTLGVLVANDEAPGKRDDLAADALGKTSRIFVGRARYDLYAESSIGVMATDREFLDSYSRVAAVDGRFRLGRTSSLTMLYAGSQHRDETGAERTGPTAHVAYNRQGRNLSYGASFDTVDPNFRTDTGFVQRVDTRSTRANAAYRWWPDNLVSNWGPFASYGRIYDFAGVLQDEQTGAGVRATLANGIITVANVNQDLEHYGGIDFRKTSAFIGGGASASRKIAFGGFLNWGDQIRYGDAPFLGRSVNTTVFVNLRPTSRLSADLNLITSRLHDPMTEALVFDVKILRTFTTYQLTNRLALRNITEYNSLNRTLGANVLFTYRVNAGTVFFVGYDDHYQQEDLIDAVRFPTTALRQTNRAFFTKLSYLFRY